MKIALSANGPDFDAQVGQRFGTAEYLLIVDLESESVEAIHGPSGAGQRGAGIQVISMAISRGAHVVLTGYCSPAICNQMEQHNIKVITGVSGSVREVVAHYRQGLLTPEETPEVQARARKGAFAIGTLLHALRQSAWQLSYG